MGLAALEKEALLQVFHPGFGAICLGVKPSTLPLQGLQSLGLVLQPGLQVTVSLQQVVAVLQEVVGSQTLPPYGCQQVTEDLHSGAGTHRRHT